jgi:hypothetical protein
LIRAVQETELGMEVEMHEGRSHGGILGGQGRRSQTHEEEEGMEPDDLLCSRNARPPKALVGRAQWKINQPPSLKRMTSELGGATFLLVTPLASSPVPLA